MNRYERWAAARPFHPGQLVVAAQTPPGTRLRNPGDLYRAWVRGLESDPTQLGFLLTEDGTPARVAQNAGTAATYLMEVV